MSTTPPANIIITADTVVERAHPLDDSFENNASDLHGTNAANSDTENIPNLFDNTDEDTVCLHNNTSVTASVPINHHSASGIHAHSHKDLLQTALTKTSDCASS